MQGVPGSGKSSTVARLAADHNAIVICLDDIRQELTGDAADQSGLMRFAVRGGGRVNLRSQLNELQRIRCACWDVARFPPGNLVLRNAGAPCNFRLRQRAPQ